MRPGDTLEGYSIQLRRSYDFWVILIVIGLETWMIEKVLLAFFSIL